MKKNQAPEAPRQLPKVHQVSDPVEFAQLHIKFAESFIDALQKTSGVLSLGKKRSIRQLQAHNAMTADSIEAAKGGDTSQLEALIPGLRKTIDTLAKGIVTALPGKLDKIAEVIDKTNEAFIKREGAIINPTGAYIPAKFANFGNFNNHPVPAKGKGSGQGSAGRGGGGNNGNTIKISPDPLPVTVTNIHELGNRKFMTTILGWMGWNKRQSEKEEANNRRAKGLAGASNRRGGGDPLSVFGKIKHGVESILDLPKIILGIFGRVAMTIISSLTRFAIGAVAGLFSLLVTRLPILAAAAFADSDMFKDFTKNLLEGIFGADSGITKAITEFMQSNEYSRMVTGAGLGAMVGMLFGPAGALVGALVGGLGTLIYDWIKADGPAKLWQGFENWWEGLKESANTMVDGWIKGFKDWASKTLGEMFKLGDEAKAEYDEIAKIIDNFFKGLADGVRNALNYLGEQATKIVDSWNGKRVTDEDISKVGELQGERDKAAGRIAEIDRQLQDPNLTVQHKRGLQNQRNFFQNRVETFDERLKEVDNKRIELEAHKPNVEKGLVTKPLADTTSELNKEAIKAKAIATMALMAGTNVSAPTQIVTTSNVNQNNNSHNYMKLSPISGVEIN